MGISFFNRVILRKATKGFITVMFYDYLEKC